MVQTMYCWFFQRENGTKHIVRAQQKAQSISNC